LAKRSSAHRQAQRQKDGLNAPSRSSAKHPAHATFADTSTISTGQLQGLQEAARNGALSFPSTALLKPKKSEQRSMKCFEYCRGEHSGVASGCLCGCGIAHC
jgi:hypothetical protein